MNRKMMQNLNLCTDPWLPVRMQSGDCRRLSLEDFFLHAREISDMVLAAHERIAIMRLLICITQRAINGPQDREEWDECKDSIPHNAVAYLKEWRHAFNLIGEDGAFLQPSGVKARKDEDWGDFSKISMASAEGNTPALFDNAAGSERKFDLCQVAIDLLSFQNCAPGGTIGVALWNGVQTGAKSPDSAPGGPCIPASAIHLFVCGENMLDTIWYNLCTSEDLASFRNGMGVPVWECMPAGMNDLPAIKNATTTYLGRLVPLSRVVKISGHNDKCLVAKGLTYPVYSEDKALLYYESTMSVVLAKDGARHIVGADISKAMWRNLPAILHRFSSEAKTFSFSCLDEQDLPEHYGIWVGAMVLDQAKVLGTLEDYYEHMDRGCVGLAADKRQAALMRMADNGISLLKTALMSYYAFVNSPFDNKKQVFAHAEKNYWGKLTAKKDIYVRCLGASAENPELYDSVRALWSSAICGAASTTFDLLVSRNNVSQLAAWARARQKLPNNTILMKDNGK